MGLDFVRKVAKSFHKGLDRDRIGLATLDLFTQYPTFAQRAYAATVHDGQRVSAGDELSVRLEGEQVVLLRGLDLVATVDIPSVELKEALSSSYGEACGTVLQVHTMAHMAEVRVC
jgi:hypothetical protein